MHRRFSDEQEELIVNSFIKGKRLTELAREWHCGHSMIINVLERSNINRAARRALIYRRRNQDT